MKKITQILTIASLLCISINTYAQLDNVLKKAKDKVTKETITNKKEPMQEQKTMDEKINKQPETHTDNNMLFELTSSRGTEIVSIGTLKDGGKSINSYTSIRKQGEVGFAHVAKDYPELKGIINDDIFTDKFAIEFSSAPYNKGIGTAATQFNSTKREIYCNIKPLKGTIGNAFGVAEKGKNIGLYFKIYSAESENIGGNEGANISFFISANLAKQNYLTLDVMPKLDNYTLYTTKYQDTDEPFGYKFPFFHNQENFPKSGKYSVAMYIEDFETDEYGKITGNTKQAVAVFNYDFMVKDVEAIQALGNAIWENSKQNAKTMPQAIPEQWKEKSSTPSMGIVQAKLIEMYRNEYEDKLAGFTLVKFYASASAGGWTVEKNDLGIPLYRYSNQGYTVFMKSNDGKTCFYQHFGLRQNYDSGGNYLAIFIDKQPYVYVKCEELK